jgi:hypothetical protein
VATVSKAVLPQAEQQAVRTTGAGSSSRVVQVAMAAMAAMAAVVKTEPTELLRT